jgi:hypothetical protein
MGRTAFGDKKRHEKRLAANGPHSLQIPFSSFELSFCPKLLIE